MKTWMISNIISSLYKSANLLWLKGWVSMLPWHTIPFLKGLSMLIPNPWENGWPRLWRSCNWQKNTQLNHSMAPKEPYRESEWADVSPLLKYFSGAVAPLLKAPKGPYQASFFNSKMSIICVEWKNSCPLSWPHPMRLVVIVWCNLAYYFKKIVRSK